MCDPATAALVIGTAYTGYTMNKTNRAENKARSDQFDAEMDMKKADKKAKKDAEAKAITDQSNAATAATQERKKREDMFRKYGYRGTFGSSGGSLGLTSPVSGSKNTLLGGS